jgi:hypothetical protein
LRGCLKRAADDEQDESGDVYGPKVPGYSHLKGGDT